MSVVPSASQRRVATSIAAFFDVDNTLLPGEASEVEFFRWLRERRVIGWPEVRAGIGLNTGMTALMPAAKVPCVVVLGKIEEKPVVRRGEIVVRTILPLTGTFDHRIVDGMQIGKLARGLKRAFRKPEWLDAVPEKELENCIFEIR